MSIHLGIIPDGNRRWCKNNNKTELEYIDTIQNMIKSIFNNNDYPTFKLISELSIYVLSKDNIIKRDQNIIKLIETIIDFISILLSTNENNIKINIIGDMTILPITIQERLEVLTNISLFKLGKQFPINLAIGYDPIKDSKKYLEEGTYSRNQIDLVVRSGGELRSSGFFPLQTLYSEWVYLDKMWPDITMKDIHESILKFQKRKRNFGK
jgi:undecaprenyl pyrophosphate synthase